MPIFAEKTVPFHSVYSARYVVGVRWIELNFTDFGTSEARSIDPSEQLMHLWLRSENIVPVEQGQRPCIFTGT